MSISICLITTAVCLSVDICALRILESDLSRDTAFTSERTFGKEIDDKPISQRETHWNEITHVCVKQRQMFRISPLIYDC